MTKVLIEVETATWKELKIKAIKENTSAYKLVQSAIEYFLHPTKKPSSQTT